MPKSQLVYENCSDHFEQVGGGTGIKEAMDGNIGGGGGVEGQERGWG